MTSTVTVADLIRRATEAHRALADLGETVEDEWSYVNDLHVSWAARLAEVSAARSAEPARPETISAVDAAIAETARIVDPHRAIDWLSTFPQVILLGLAEPA
jgi:hypothetical protein